MLDPEDGVLLKCKELWRNVVTISSLSLVYDVAVSFYKQWKKTYLPLRSPRFDTEMPRDRQSLAICSPLALYLAPRLVCNAVKIIATESLRGGTGYWRRYSRRPRKMFRLTSIYLYSFIACSDHRRSHFNLVVTLMLKPVTQQ